MSKLLEFWKKEEAASFKGWDFSYINDRMHEEPLPWSYEKWLCEFLKTNTRLLDMGTGGGEFLLSLNHNPLLTVATEAWKPNYALCKKRLEPMGIKVEFTEDYKPLPFENDSFDLIINRHGSYNLLEVSRVLKKGGYFITQQIGAQNGKLLSDRLGLNYQVPNPLFNLENEVLEFKKSGLRIVKSNQSYPLDYFTDIGALCYYAKIISWEFPDFSVDRCKEQLFEFQAEIEKTGKVLSQQHRFIIVSKNTKN